MNRRLVIALTSSALLALTACGSDSAEETTTDADTTTESSDTTSSDDASADGEVVTLTVGASPVPHGDILRFVDENLAADAGLDIEIVEYSDYVLPNKNLAEGNLDANYFQHVPYFNAEVEANGYDFQHGEGIHIEPYAAYSEKISSLDELPEGGTISIVNDPANQARALWLLEDEGVLTLADVESPTIFDIEDNPKNIEFVEVEAPNLVRTLADVDAAIINGNFALEGGLVPSEDGIAIESGEDNPYGNVLAWRTDTDKADAISKLDELLHSDEVANFIEETYPNGEVIPAF